MKNISLKGKTCLCTQKCNFDVWTCGQTTWCLKDTARLAADGSYELLSAEHVFRDYPYSTDNKVALPG